MLAKQLDSSPVVKPPDKAEGMVRKPRLKAQVPGGHKESEVPSSGKRPQGPTAGMGPAMTCCVPKAVGPKAVSCREVWKVRRLELWQNKKF